MILVHSRIQGEQTFEFCFAIFRLTGFHDVKILISEASVIFEKPAGLDLQLMACRVDLSSTPMVSDYFGSCLASRSTAMLC